MKCFVDDPDDPDAFTVDVMPVLRQADDMLLIPDAHRSGWIVADPEHLINLVQARQQACTARAAALRRNHDGRICNNASACSAV